MSFHALKTPVQSAGKMRLPESPARSRVDCRLAVRLLSRRLDVPLDWSARFFLGLHLLRCRSCRRYTHQLRLLRLWLRAPRGFSRADFANALPPAISERLKVRLAAATELSNHLTAK